MINDFLIISCIGNDDKLGLRINKEFFIRNFENKNNYNEHLVLEITKFLRSQNVKLDENFSVIVNQGPGSFSGIRISLAVAKGLEIAKKVKIFSYNSENLLKFDQKNVEQLLDKNLNFFTNLGTLLLGITSFLYR